jgi:hypothetical protein
VHAVAAGKSVMTGLRKFPPVLDEQWFSDAVDFWGGPTLEAQICSLKILLHGAEPNLLSSWQSASDKSKIDPAKIYGGILSNPLTSDLDFADHKALNVLLEILASDPGSPATGQIWFRSDTNKISIRRAAITDRVVLETLAQTLDNKTLTTPTIGSFTNAGHSHLSAAGGGTITKAAVSDFAHKASHVVAAGDAFAGGDLLDATSRLKVSKAGALIGVRRQLNLIQGTGVTLTIVDDSPNEKVDVTIDAAGGGAASGWENVVCYPWGGTAVLSADPLYDYNAEVSDATGSYVEAYYFDFDMPAGNIKSVFANLVWAMKITGAGNGYTKWQVASGSHASPGTYYDMTDEHTETATIYSDHSRSGVIHKITNFPTTTPFVVRLMVKKGTATSAETKIKSNTYFRVTFKVT